MTSPTPQIFIRPPSTISPTSTSTSTSPTFTPPPLLFLSTTWHITHSTLPMWKSKRNVTITYTPLPPPSSSDSTSQFAAAKLACSPATAIPQLDDLVQSQEIGKEKVHEVHGIDTASASESGTGAWEWRGKGVLMVAGSHWEVLGWGPRPTGAPSSAPSTTPGSADPKPEDDGEGEAWLVIYFAKTIFTPAGVDIFSRRKEGLGREVLEGVLEGLRGVGARDEGFEGLVGGLFEVRRD